MVDISGPMWLYRIGAWPQPIRPKRSTVLNVLRFWTVGAQLETRLLPRHVLFWNSPTCVPSVIWVNYSTSRKNMQKYFKSSGWNELQETETEAASLQHNQQLPRWIYPCSKPQPLPPAAGRCFHGTMLASVPGGTLDHRAINWIEQRHTNSNQTWCGEIHHLYLANDLLSKFCFDLSTGEMTMDAGW